MKSLAKSFVTITATIWNVKIRGQIVREISKEQQLDFVWVYKAGSQA